MYAFFKASNLAQAKTNKQYISIDLYNSTYLMDENQEARNDPKEFGDKSSPYL